MLRSEKVHHTTPHMHIFLNPNGVKLLQGNVNNFGMEVLKCARHSLTFPSCSHCFLLYYSPSMLLADLHKQLIHIV